MCTCNNLELLNTLSNVLFLFPWFFMLPTPQTIFFQPLSALCIFSRLCSASETMFNTSSHRTLSPCCSIAFLPIVAIELTENPSSKCVSHSVPKSFPQAGDQAGCIVAWSTKLATHSRIWKWDAISTYLLKTVVYAVTLLFLFCFHGGSSHDIPQNRFP